MNSEKFLRILLKRLPGIPSETLPKVLMKISPAFSRNSSKDSFRNSYLKYMYELLRGFIRECPKLFHFNFTKNIYRVWYISFSRYSFRYFFRKLFSKWMRGGVRCFRIFLKIPENFFYDFHQGSPKAKLFLLKIFVWNLSDIPPGALPRTVPKISAGIRLEIFL